MIVAKGVGVINGRPGGVMICWTPGVMNGIGGCLVANGGGCMRDWTGFTGEPGKVGVAPGVAQADGDAMAFAGSGSGIRMVQEPDAQVAVIS